MAKKKATKKVTKPTSMPRVKAAATKTAAISRELRAATRIVAVNSPTNFNIIVDQYNSGAMSGWDANCPVKKDVLSGALQLAGYYPVERLRELAAAAPRVDVFQWRPLMRWRRRNKLQWRSQYQAYGTCVGQGTATAARCLQAILWEKYNMSFASQVSVAGAYTFSRVEVGGQPGYWEGSSGIWAAKGLVEFGAVTMQMLNLPEDDYTKDENMAMQWTASRQGVPDAIEQAARARHAKSYTVAKTCEDVALAMLADSVVTCCSNRWGDGQRDANGFWSGRANRGGHCECWDGVMFNTDGTIKGFHVAGSWSDQFGSGPRIPDDALNGSGWIYPREAELRVAQGEVVLISGFEGEKPVPTNFSMI